MILIRNYLPGPLDTRFLDSIDAVFVDPYPITIPSKPLYTISNWYERVKEVAGEGLHTVAMIQTFGGWPFAGRARS